MQPQFTKIEQLGFVVRDLMESVREYSDKYGIGPWFFIDFDENNLDNVVLNGKPVQYRLKIAVCDMFSVQLELLQPNGGESTFSKFLEERGPGLHHMSVLTREGYHETLAMFERNGSPTEQTAVVDKQELCAFSDHMEKLGTYLELHQRGDDFKYPPFADVYPPGADVPPPVYKK